MADVYEGFETRDIVGTTDEYPGTLGTSWTPIPSVAGTRIQNFTVYNDVDNSITETIEISLDGGTTVLDKLYPSGHLSRTVKSNQRQIWIKGASVSVKYYVTLNRESA